MKTVTFTIKLPLFQPTKVKQEMYQTMRNEFSYLCNETLRLKHEENVKKLTEIDSLLKEQSTLPTTLQQEARKLAISRYQDWKKNQKTKGFPSFKPKQTILFNNQNWHLRFDNGMLKLGIPTTEKGNLTIEKYVPVATNKYSSFWVHYLVNNKMDKENKMYHPSYEQIVSCKKGNAQLYERKGTWYFSFSITLSIQEQEISNEKIVGVDRGLRMIAVAGCGETGEHITFNGKHIGHIRRKYHRLRKVLQKAKNMKKLKQLENKEQRIISYYNHLISKRILQFAEQIGVKTIKLEELSGIRGMKKYWKRSDLNIHSWAFFDLEQKLKYKAVLHGIEIDMVNPFKTSQECHNCGKAEKRNRRKDKYKCSCGYKEHADINASFVISKRPSLVA